LTGKPTMTVNEARERLELEPVQGGDVLADGYDATQPTEPAQVDEMPDVEGDTLKSAELARLHTFITNGRHLKRQFKSDVLTPAEIDREIVAISGRKQVKDHGEEYARAIGEIIEQAVDGKLDAKEMEAQWRQLAYATHSQAFRRGMGLGNDEALMPSEEDAFMELLSTEYDAIERTTGELFDGLGKQD
jgi:hypothetical protein